MNSKNPAAKRLLDIRIQRVRRLRSQHAYCVADAKTLRASLRSSQKDFLEKFRVSPAAVLCGKLNYKAKGLCLAHAIHNQPKSLVGGFSQLLFYVERRGRKHQVHAINTALGSSVDVGRNDSRKG
jgi:hypothetical protein